MAGNDLLFVYGTLRSNGDEMHPLLGMAVFVGEAWWRGRLYLVDGYPGAVPDETCSTRVTGELYRLADPAQTLAELDAYEECGPRYGDDAEYIRIVTRVTLSDGTVRHAWIYRYNRTVEGLVRIESGDFCNHKEHSNGKGENTGHSGGQAAACRRHCVQRASLSVRGKGGDGGICPGAGG